MALLAIAGWVETRAYDLIVVDTAPTGHTLRLLTTPDLIRTWLKALDALLAKHRFMQQRFRGSYQRRRTGPLSAGPGRLGEADGGSAAESPRLPLCAGDAGGRPRHQRDPEAPGRTEASADPGQGGGGQPPLSGEFLPPVRRGAAASMAAPERAIKQRLLKRVCLVGRAPVPGGNAGPDPGDPLGWGHRGGCRTADPSPAPPGNTAPGGGRASLPLSRDHLLDLRRQGGGGQNHPGLRHRGAPGSGVPRERRSCSSPPTRPTPWLPAWPHPSDPCRCASPLA